MRAQMSVFEAFIFVPSNWVTIDNNFKEKSGFLLLPSLLWLIMLKIQDENLLPFPFKTKKISFPFKTTHVLINSEHVKRNGNNYP